MATPNIINTSTVNGNIAVLNANTVGMSNVVINSAGSGRLMKINTVTIANYNTSSVSANVEVFRDGVGYKSSPELGKLLLESDADQLIQLINKVKRSNKIEDLQNQFYRDAENPLNTKQ